MTKKFTIRVVSGLQCPKCGAGECHPTDKDSILIRAFKVCDKEGDWWSQCLVCSGGYRIVEWNHGVTIYGKFDQTKHDSEKGWFA